MLRSFIAACVAVSIAAALLPPVASASPSYKELLARPRHAPDQKIAYGKDQLQYGDLYLPKGDGPHPVVVLIHGGCWLAELPGPELMDPMAAALQAGGFAVWNIEYRRIGHGGGGYPGTFTDAGKAIDALRTFAPKHRLDLGRVVLVGHSAGGHLAVWAGARAKVPGALHVAHPLAVKGVVSLSGILDLEAYRESGGEPCGMPDTIDALVGRHAELYADTSPARLLPTHVRQAIVSGEKDRIVAPRFGHDYAAKAKAAGDEVSDIEIAGAGHFDLIDPEAPAWTQVLAAIEDLLR
jgi:acetyl esterase/lipase